MPRSKKNSDASSLSDVPRKVLLRCRMLLIRDLDVAEIIDRLSGEDALKPDVCEQIMKLPVREQRVGVLLDRLENRNDKAFHTFMDALKDRYKHLHYVLEECMKNVIYDVKNDPQQREKVALSGEAIRKLLQKDYRKKMVNSQGSAESADCSTDAEQVLDDRYDEDYIDCYAIPMRGHLQQESWIKHINAPKKDGDEEESSATTYMATLMKNFVFKKVDLRDIPNEVKKPPSHCNIFVMVNEDTPQVGWESRNNTAHVPARVRDLPELPTRAEVSTNDPTTEDIPSSQPPPPVPPKPENLPPLSLVPNTKTKQEKPDIVPEVPFILKPPPRTTSQNKTDSEKTKIPPRPLPKPVTEPSPVRKIISVFEASGKMNRDDPCASPNEVTPRLPPRGYLLRQDEDKEEEEEAEGTADEPPELPSTPQPNSTENDEDSTDILSPQETDFPAEIEEEDVVEEEEDEEEDEVAEQECEADDEETPTADQTNVDFPEGVSPEIYISSSCSTVSTTTLTQDLSKNQKSPLLVAQEEKRCEEVEIETEELYEPISPSECYLDESQLASAIPPPCEEMGNDLLEPDDVIPNYGSPSPRPKSDSNNNTKESRGSSPEVGAQADDHVQDGSSKASGESLDSRCSLIGASESMTTDSGRGSVVFQTPIIRRSSKKSDRPSSSGGNRPLTVDVDITPSDNSSTSDDSYYEDIDMLDTCHSPSIRSTGTYLDPKAYGLRTHEKSGRSDVNRQSMMDVVDAPKTIVLHKGEQLIAEQALVVEDDVIDSIESKYECNNCFKNACLVYDKDGNAFYVPTYYLKKFGDPQGEVWFYPIRISSRQATLFLGAEKQEGCFLVYEPVGKVSSVKYNLSLCRAEGDVVHYHIVENVQGDLMIDGHDHSFMTILDLVQYFRRNKSQLATKLRRPLKEARMPITPGYHYDVKYELNRAYLNLTGKIIGKGQFGVVCSGEYRGSTVAVKVLQGNEISTAAEDDFLEEAKVLMELRHEHILRLIGVSCSARPFFIITELVARGSLRDCLKNRTLPSDSIDTLFDLCIQTTAALYYLESQRYVLHRDVAARNFLLTADMCVKLADFGRARFVSDDHYQASQTEKISIKWAAPEVLIHSEYSTKSDVWSLGIVYWEIFSGGERPYSSLNSEHTVIYVLDGGRLDKPPGCTPDLYNMMTSCWQEYPSQRPSFTALYDKLKSKSTIYYTPTLRLEKTASLPPGLSRRARSALSPLSPGKSNTLQSTTKGPKLPKSRRTAVYEPSKTQSCVDATDYSRQLFLEGFPSSSSEVSLTSANGMPDDLNRGGIIRKSLRKIGMMKSKKKQLSKDNSKEEVDVERQSTPFYTPV